MNNIIYTATNIQKNIYIQKLDGEEKSIYREKNQGEKNFQRLDIGKNQEYIYVEDGLNTKNTYIEKKYRVGTD